MASLIGKTLGKYRLVARLGRGGMAEVYKAYQPGMRRYVSVKVLHTHMVDDKNFVGRFEREALAVGKLRHPNIVQAFDFDREGDLYFMAMEFIDGPTLTEELEARHSAGKPFNLKEIARIFIALCSAIDYAHTRGMIHRDLKPANVMINPEGQVVLTDFGIARIMGATTYTQTGALSGTPHYMSPEQGQGQHGDERSDIYALGVMLYEIVTGAVPYDADTPFMVILKHIHEPVPPPTRVVPGLPKAVEQVIFKAMSKNPEERYQRAGELAIALREAVGLAPEEIYSPLTTIAPHRQIEEMDPTTGIFPAREKTSPASVQPSGGGTLVGPQPGATVAQAVTARRASLIPLLIGGGLLVLLLLAGLVVGAFLLNQQERVMPAALPLAAADNATSTAIALAQAATATTAALVNATATAQAEATAAVLGPPAQTAQAATAQAEATAVQQTAEARVLEVVQSALGNTATAAAIKAATATATVEQAQATQTAAAQAMTEAAVAQAAATETAAAQASQTAEAQAAQANQATETQATQTAQAQAAQMAQARALSKTGLFNDFEFTSTWKRGDEPNGTFERTTAQAHSGRYSGQLSYQFPTPGNDYVVFLWSQLLGEKPNQITAWVYGDGQGHFLNAWLKDNAGETWQFSFGQVKHKAWQQMTAFISPSQPWPAGHVDGPSNGVVDYPLSFQGLVLDDGSDDYSGSGTIYIDDLASAEGTLPPAPTLAPAAAPASPITFNADRTTLGAGECTLLSWGVENVSAVFLNGEGVPGQYSRQVCPGATTTYTLLVILRDGSTTSKVITITVQ